jgi:hypothetical protein
MQGSLDAARTIVRSEGPFALYRGFTMTQVKRVSCESSFATRASAFRNITAGVSFAAGFDQSSSAMDIDKTFFIPEHGDIGCGHWIKFSEKVEFEFRPRL